SSAAYNLCRGTQSYAMRKSTNTANRGDLRHKAIWHIVYNSTELADCCVTDSTARIGAREDPFVQRLT
ncbi:MAG: hypothetical protein AAF387_19785, partial [Pseudomonadota bacterium]